MAAVCGTALNPSGSHCVTYPLVLMLWQPSGAWKRRRNRVVGVRRAVSWSTVTAAPPPCAALCSATMLCCRFVNYPNKSIIQRAIKDHKGRLMTVHLFLGGAWLPQLFTHLCKGAPPGGVCQHCTASPLPLHHHHHTHTTSQVVV